MLVLAYLTSDFEFKIQSALWEEHIVPVIIRLENIAQTRPIKSSFENDEEFEEALGFWMGRQGKVIAVNLSQAFMKWEELK